MSHPFTNRSVWRSLKLWVLACAFAALSTLHGIAQADHPALQSAVDAQPPVIELSASQVKLALDGVAEYWVEDDLHASAAQIDARSRSSTPSALHFRPYLAHNTQVIDGRVLWIRFDAVNKEPNARWLLEVGLPTVDDVSLAWRDDSGKWTQQRAGDHMALRDWPVHTHMPVFALDATARGPVTYYLRVVHQRVPFTAPIHLVSAAQLLADQQREHFWLGAYFGLALLMVVLGAVNAALQSEKMFSLYALYMAALVLVHAVSTGLGAFFLWPNATNWARVAEFVTPSAALIAGLWLIRASFTPQRMWPLLDAAVLGVMAVQVVATVADALWPTVQSFLLANSAALVALVATTVLLWMAVQRHSAGSRWMALGFLPLMLASMLPVLRNLGVLHTGFVTQYATMVASVVAAPMLLFALFARASQRRLSRVRTAALMQSDPLTGLTNDRALMQNLHGSLMRAERYRHQFALALVELANLDWFNKEHGRLMGDRALLLLATRMASVARNVDTAARLQDNMFVLLIEGPTSSAQAVAAATQILSRSLRPSEQLPVGASLKVQITLALMPDTQSLDFGEDASACLNWVVAHSADLHEVPRKAIRTINF